MFRPINQIIVVILLIVILAHFHHPKQSEPDRPSPVVTKGLVVLVKEDVDERGSLPQSKIDIFNSGAIRDYLNTHCVQDSSGKPECRMVDKSVNMSEEPQPLIDAFNLANASLPEIVISNGSQGTHEPLPPDVASTLTLLKKYGGN